MQGDRKRTLGQTPRAEDYLEAVYHLIQDKGYTTTSEVSNALEVKPPTASHMIRKLTDRKYLVHKRYQGMKLTPTGERMAKSVIKRHEVIAEFLSMLGVDDQTAYEDTEGMEHHVQWTTLHRIERLAEYLRHNPAALRVIRKYIDAD
jgi:DtxR family transcriptional regulator, manganese transport regulator